MMRRFSIRLAVALVTFFVGLQLAWLVAALFGPAVTSEEVKGVYAAPPAVRKRSCPTSPRLLDVPPPPPAPPAEVNYSRSLERTRVVVRRADGSVEVVETRRAPR